MKLLWWLFFLISILIAWLLGYRFRLEEEEKPRKLTLPKDYLEGLTFLLNEETDKAVDALIKMLELDSDTVEMHLALGKLFRNRGEVDRAIRIHQNLIARPQLAKHHREQSLYELGYDYFSAGVLDRAERIFQELLNTKFYASKALLMLIDIYQQEKLWDKAVWAALQYEKNTNEDMASQIGHYYCEMAERSRQEKQFHQAYFHLEKALKRDPKCVRASLLYANLAISENDFELALRYLHQIQKQNPEFLSLAIDLIVQCYQKLQREHELMEYLDLLLRNHPKLSAVLILMERIGALKINQLTLAFVMNYVKQYPSLRGLSLIISLYCLRVSNQQESDFHDLYFIINMILKDKSLYQCIICGFSGKVLYWLCPECKKWGTISPVFTVKE